MEVKAFHIRRLHNEQLQRNKKIRKDFNKSLIYKLCPHLQSVTHISESDCNFCTQLANLTSFHFTRNIGLFSFKNLQVLMHFCTITYHLANRTVWYSISFIFTEPVNTNAVKTLYTIYQIDQRVLLKDFLLTLNFSFSFAT